MDRNSDRLPILVGDVVVVLLVAVEADVTEALLLLLAFWFRRGFDLARRRGEAFLSPMLSRSHSNEAIMTAGG
jgi:hypothetical protein